MKPEDNKNNKQNNSNPDDENPVIIYIVWFVLGAIIVYSLVRSMI